MMISGRVLMARRAGFAVSAINNTKGEREGERGRERERERETSTHWQKK
jgi:hypothetical protein